MQFQSNQSEKLIKNSNKTEGGGTKNNWVYAELHFSLKNGFFKAIYKISFSKKLKEILISLWTKKNPLINLKSFGDRASPNCVILFPQS